MGRPCALLPWRRSFLQARVSHGKSHDGGIKRALDSARDVSQQASAVFPLSTIHYIETAKIQDPRRPERLGTTMWGLSRGYTLVAYHYVVRHELEAARVRRFLTVPKASQHSRAMEAVRSLLRQDVLQRLFKEGLHGVNLRCHLRRMSTPISQVQECK